MAIPSSYWHATFTPPVPDADLPSTSDVVVVGGGLLGCWTAYWLAKQGVQVTLLEKTAISWGATGRNGGFLMSGTSAGYRHTIATIGHQAARDLHALTRRGQALVYEVVAEEGIECDLRTPGTMHLTLAGEDEADVIAGVEALHADGFPGELLDRHGVQAHMRTPLADDVIGGVFQAEGGLLHSGRYLAGIAAAAQRHGARLVRAGVSSLTPDGEGTIIETTVGTIRAGRVIVALNAWCDELVPAVAGKIVPVRGQILAYEPADRAFDCGLGAAITPTGEYWQQTPDGSIVIGGCRADAPGGDVGVREMTPTPDVTAKIEDVIPRLFPKLAGLPVARRWAGLMAFTSDYLPVADAVPDMPGVWVTGGYCGHGMPFGPIVGQLLADAAVTGHTPSALAALALDRPSLTLLATPLPVGDD
jgi:glycine/D-amino acid oxidase-like deaminating enzyme